MIQSRIPAAKLIATKKLMKSNQNCNREKTIFFLSTGLLLLNYWAKFYTSCKTSLRHIGHVRQGHNSNLSVQ